MNDRRAGTTVGLTGLRKRNHVRMFCEHRMHRQPQLADPFSVNDPHLQDAARPAFGQIISDHASYVRRPERVQVQDAVDGKLDGLAADFVGFIAVVHGPILIQGPREATGLMHRSPGQSEKFF